MKRFLLAVLALAIVAGSVVVAKGLIAARPEMETQSRETLPPPVTTAVATPGPVTLTLHSQGTVRAKQRLQLTSDVSGRITWVSDRFQEGMLVEPDEPLLKIDPMNYQLAVAQAKLNLREAELSLADAESRFRRGAGSAKHPQLKRAEAQVDAAHVQLKKAQQDLERTVIRSPFAAIVSGKHVALGQFVTSASSLGELQGSAAVEVALPFNARDLQLLETNPDLKIHLSTDGSQAAGWDASSYRLHKQLDDQTRVAYLIADVLDPYTARAPGRDTLYIGQFVKAEINGIVIHQAFELPLSALYEEQYVYRVDKEERLQRTPVEVLRYTDNNVIIRSGLSGGERIALTRLSIMADGMHVTANDQQNIADNSENGALQ